MFLPTKGTKMISTRMPIRSTTVPPKLLCLLMTGYGPSVSRLHREEFYCELPPSWCFSNPWSMLLIRGWSCGTLRFHWPAWPWISLEHLRARIRICNLSSQVARCPCCCRTWQFGKPWSCRRSRRCWWWCRTRSYLVRKFAKKTKILNRNLRPETIFWFFLTILSWTHIQNRQHCQFDVILV